ncbi:unnamed protein product [Trichobilharzia szidati]|nr:unnamed protein product [Trichobilharzia szidati]
MLMNLNNFMEAILPKTSTPTKEANKTNYPGREEEEDGEGDKSTDNTSMQIDVVNSYTNILSPVVSPIKNATITSTTTTDTDISSNDNISINDNQQHTVKSSECNNSSKNNDNNNNDVTESKASKEPLQGYTLINNQENLETNELKMRLLAALAEMIPHDESLSLRLLMNYTIDDQESECVVIDETLCKGVKYEEGNNRNSTNPQLNNNNDSYTSCESLTKENQYHESSKVLTETSSTRSMSYEPDALDLSLHTEATELVDYHGEQSSTESAGDDYNLKPRITPSNVDAILNDIKPSLSICSTSTNLNTMRTQESAVSTASTTTTTTATSTPVSQIPLLDSTLLALLPLLQQQHQQQQQQQNQQQQQQNTNVLTYQSVLNPNTLSLLSTPIPVSTPTTLTTTKQNPITFNLTANTTSNTNTNHLFFNQLYSSNAATHFQQNIHPSTNSLLTTNLSSILPKQTEMISTTSTGGISNPINSSLMNSVINNNNQSLLNTASIIGFPLFNPFSLHANTTSTIPSNNNNSSNNNGNNNDQFNGILQPTSFLSSTPTISQTLLSSTIPQSGITSFNLSPVNTATTLFNLKDKQTGLIEAVGILPNMKNLNQPIATLLNQLAVNSSSNINNNNNSNNISLKTLSTLSQLFCNNLVTATTPTTNNNGNNSSGNSATTNNFNITNNHNTNITIPAIINTNINNNHISLGSENDPVVVSKNSTKKSSSSGKASSRSSPGNPSNGHSSSAATSKLNSSTEHKTDAMKSSASVRQIKESTSSNNTNINSNNSFLFGRRLTHSRRFICNQCRRNFSSLAELNRHTIETHNSFRCTICSAHFTQRSNLQRHSLKHVGFKPFTCNLCKKEYYRKDHLVRHIEVTHPTHDPKMNITVHLTSSECLDYLDRLNAGKQTPSPIENSQPENDLPVSSATEVTTATSTTTTTTNITTDVISTSSHITPNITDHAMNGDDDFDILNEESMKIEEARLETPDAEMNDDNLENATTTTTDNNNNNNTEEDMEEADYDVTDCNNVN